ncbi:MAG: choice-of-anchor B family protein, partial [Flavobacteriales bacterium]
YGTRTHIFNIADLNAVTYSGFYEGSSTSIDHNLYALDQFIYESNYRSGVRVLDAIDVSSALLEEVAYFDLFPTNDFAAFSGTWSNYPYLPSGIVLATSMYDGLFILKPTLIQLSQSHWDLCNQSVVTFNLQINANLNFPLSVQVNGIPGLTAMSSPITGTGNASVVISNIDALTPGEYHGTLGLVTGGGAQYEVPISFHIYPNLISPCSIGGNGIPMDGQVLPAEVSAQYLSWFNDQDASSYSIDIAADPGFSNIVASYTTANNQIMIGEPLPLGTYYWRVRGENPCGPGPWAVFAFEVTTTIGIQEARATSIMAVPNPAHGRFTLYQLNSAESVCVTDMQGKVIQQVGAEKSSMEFDVSLWAPGIYHIQNGHSSVRIAIY